MRIVDELVEVVERPEDRIDLAVVGDVVARVGLGGGVERVQPDRVDAQLADIGQPGPDPGRSPTPSPSESAKLRT